MKATLLLPGIHKEFLAKITLGEILKTLTVRKLAQIIEKQDKSHYLSIEPVKKKEKASLAALVLMQ